MRIVCYFVPFVWLVGWVVGWLLGCLVAWLLGCLVAWLVGWLVAWSISQGIILIRSIDVE